MNILKKICTLCFIFILPLTFCACNKTDLSENNSLYGVLIYQNIPGNENYETLKDDISSIITISNSTLSTTDISLLYFNCENFENTNTTYTLNNKTLNLEIYLETTEVSVCLIYKDKNDKLNFSNTITKSITKENTNIYELDNLTITASKNLTYKKG